MDNLILMVYFLHLMSWLLMEFIEKADLNEQEEYNYSLIIGLMKIAEYIIIAITLIKMF